MQANTAFRIQKNTVNVGIKDALRELEQVEIYVAGGPSLESRGERLQDILEERRFLPVRHDERTELISTPHLSWVKMSLIDALDELDPEVEQLGGLSVRVRVDLEDGASLDGMVRYCLPPAASRLADYLASIDRWFPLRTPEWLYLINRDHVMRVLPLDEA